MSVIPSTVERVPENTNEEVQNRIDRQTLANLEYYKGRSADEIEKRLEELDREWSIERTLEANAGAIGFTGIVLAATVSRKWLILPAVVTGFLFQHALQGWCPPVPVFRRLGFRTPYEIDEERFPLREELRKKRGE